MSASAEKTIGQMQFTKNGECVGEITVSVTDGVVMIKFARDDNEAHMRLTAMAAFKLAKHIAAAVEVLNA